MVTSIIKYPPNAGANSDAIALPSHFLVALITISPAAAVDVLPGTQPLTWDGDISLKMVDDLHTFADRETAASVERRARHWNRDFSSR